MSETEMNYMAKFSLDTSDLSKGITGAAISFDAITMAAKEAFNIIKEGYDQTIEKAVAFGESIHTLADITGESEENIQRLRGAAIATGTSFEDVSQTIRIFSQRIGDTGTSGETLRAKLAEIGVAVQDSNGDYRSAADLYMEINQHLGDMENVYQRNNLAMDIYGRSWYSVADMITNADKAATAYKLVEPISDEDIAKAKDFGIQMGIIGDNINMVGVNIGTNLIEALDTMGESLDNVGYKVSNLSLGAFFGGGIGDGKSSGADRDPNQALKEQTAAIAPLIDKYKDMSTLQVQYLTTQQDMITAQSALDYELANGTQDSVDKASLALVNLKQKYEDVRKSMAEVANQAVATNASLNPYEGNTSGGDVGSFGGTPNADFASDLSNVSNIWAYAAANTDSASQSSDFLAQIRGVAAQAQSIQMPGGANWTNTSENQSIIRQTESLWASYQQQKTGSAGFTQINYIQGENAQQVANAIADATSKAIARQVTT